MQFEEYEPVFSLFSGTQLCNPRSWGGEGEMFGRIREKHKYFLSMETFCFHFPCVIIGNENN
jgi:hypothetical protein